MSFEPPKNGGEQPPWATTSRDADGRWQGIRGLGITVFEGAWGNLEKVSQVYIVKDKWVWMARRLPVAIIG
jgi:hypothetical protein